MTIFWKLKNKSLVSVEGYNRVKSLLSIKWMNFDIFEKIVDLDEIERKSVNYWIKNFNWDNKIEELYRFLVEYDDFKYIDEVKKTFLVYKLMSSLWIIQWDNIKDIVSNDDLEGFWKRADFKPRFSTKNNNCRTSFWAS